MRVDHGKKAEVHTSKRLGAKLTKNSGSTDKDKGDMHLEGFKVELKTTLNGSIGVKLDWLLKIKQEALEMEMDPALIFQFVFENGRTRQGGSWVAVPEHVFKELVEGRE
jgi:hypothetical protein